MDTELYICCKNMIILLEKLLAEKKITLHEYERESRLKRLFVDQYMKNHIIKIIHF
ncbi:hypothetical protein Bccel_2323 [Pseudobacteroides cellulosolvens ATCC 35603 = DSM 2933]|uniref:Uncharacterized protein n=1 Tax=Pseudobacteroides cellulosolvens ATCC 35603 = DSM 2933 TaxID=398512 RepID=A0A0L6JMS0_9FIRM|nr:hypothetical protein Bccel_2323 [Pseudobacteroides cellulosolvens ATCC 35603 = DSM 2933]